MNFFFAVINISLLFFIAYRVWKADDSLVKKFFWPALIMKLIAGICLGLVYTYYYVAGDTFAFFEDGVRLADLARQDLPLYIRFLWSGDDSFNVWSSLSLLQSRALFMVKIVSMVNLVSHDNYWITSLYFSFSSFMAAWMLVKVIIRLGASLRLPATIGFLFFPSVVFWSSGLIKESLAMASLFFLTSIFLKVWMRERLRFWEWILIPLSLWLLWNLKYYYLAVFLPVVSACLVVNLLFSERLKFKPPVYRIFIWCMVFLIPLIGVSLVRPNFYPERLLHVILSNYEEFHAISDANDLIYYNNLQPTVESILRNAPWALFSGLYRPWPWEAGTVFQVFISIENILLLILSCTALGKVKQMVRSPNGMLLFSIALYVVMLCVFLALSTPNFGTLSRYRVGFLPFFFLLITVENPVVTWMMRFIQRSSTRLVP